MLAHHDSSAEARCMLFDMSCVMVLCSSTNGARDFAGFVRAISVS
jgi:hypothetical protein